MQDLLTTSLNGYILLASILFSIGILGILIRKNIIIIFMSIELMLNAVNLLMTAFSVHHNNSDGQVFVLFIMTVAAAEVTIGLAILVMIYRNTGSVNIDDLKKMKW